MVESRSAVADVDAIRFDQKPHVNERPEQRVAYQRVEAPEALSLPGGQTQTRHLQKVALNPVQRALHARLILRY